MPRQHIQVVSVVRNHLIEALLVLSESDKNDKRSDGLPSSIVSALSLATSGMGLTHSDIGGYTGLKTFGLNMNTMHWDDGTWLEKKLHPIAYSLSKLTGSGLFGLVRTKELFLRWAEYSVFSPIMRTHEVCLTSSLQHFRFSFPTFKLIVNNTRATNRSRSTNSTQTRTQCSSLVDSRKFSPPWKIIQRSPPHSSLSVFNSKSPLRLQWDRMQ